MEIASKPIEVTVFADRARVMRRGSVSLEAGIHRLEFTDLPLALQPDSVRASGRGSAVSVLLGVETRRAYYLDTPAHNARQIELQIEALNDIERDLASQVSIAEVNVAFVKKLADESAEQLARGLALGRAQIGQGDELVGFVRRQLEEAQTNLRLLAARRRDNKKELDRLTKELERLGSARPRERYSADVEVEVKQAGDLTVELTYMLSNASWQAQYDLRAAGLDSEGPALALAYLAQITQQTGEDWDDVALVLSTARPALAAIRPELTPWYLDAFVPPPMPMQPRAARHVTLAAAMPAAMAAEDFGAGAAPVPESVMEESRAAVNSEGAAATYRLGQSVSVPSDGSPHKVNISTLDLAPRLDHISLPKLAEVVYRRATVTNHSDYTLLPGQAHLFLEGDYLGAVPLRQIAPSEEFELTLGVDDRVFVKRKLTARDVDKAFILGDRRRLRVGYEIEVRNLRAVKTSLEIRDQVPVTRSEQIKTKLEAVDPRPTSQTDLGELKWQLTLAPNEKRFARFEFSIEHPASMTVTGLP